MVRGKACSTVGTITVNAEAFGSEQLLFGQYWTICVTFDPGVSCTVVTVGGNGKLAVTFCVEVIVKLHIGLVPKLRQAEPGGPPQPPNEVDGEFGLAINVTGVPLA